MPPARSVTTSTGRFDFNIDPDQLVVAGVCAEDNKAYVSALLTSYVYLLADSPLVCGLKPRRCFSHFLRFLTTTPFREVADRYKSLAHELISNLHSYGAGSTTGPFLDEFLKTPIAREYLVFYETGNPDVLTYILTFLNFSRKAILVDSTLEPDAFRKWLSIESRLNQLQLDPDVVSDLKYLLTVLLPPPVRTPMATRFSGGSTKDGMRSLSTKLDWFRYNVYADRVFFRAQHGSERPGAVVGSLPDPNYWIKARNQVHHTIRESELMFVPKTISSLRSICKEQPEMAYFQQAVMAELVDTIHGGPLRHLVDLRDQTLNQRMAIEGSITGLLDTLDLSSASDSVSLQLVRQIFPPHVLRFLLATRSTTVVYKHNGRSMHIKVAKFSPMGSATCFPTQCIVFSAIILREYLVYTYGHEWRSHFTPNNCEKFLSGLACDAEGYPRLRCPRVYGDDLIIDSRITPGVIHLLTSLGFEVNLEKSFITSQSVRESCGIYAYCGADVTPLLWKIPHFEEKPTMKAVMALVDLCNRAGDMKYRHLHSNLVYMLLHAPLQGVCRHKGINMLKFVDNLDEFGIFSLAPRNSHLPRRQWDPNGPIEETCNCYQRDEVLSALPVTLKRGNDTRDSRVRAEYQDRKSVV